MVTTQSIELEFYSDQQVQYVLIEEGVKLDPARNEVILQRNRLARKIMQENKIQVINLYGLMKPD